MPYTEEEIRQIQENIEKAEALIPEITQRIEDMRRAGIDVTKELEALQKLKEQIRLMREVYGRYFK